MPKFKLDKAVISEQQGYRLPGSAEPIWFNKKQPTEVSDVAAEFIKKFIPELKGVKK